MNITSLEEFYRQTSNLIPENINKEIGHFNVFRIEEIRDNEALNKQIAGATALGRVGLPEDVGPVVAFLCSEGGGWINDDALKCPVA
jgi:NAD(P)-dependent dehydrogenase (short-subunit alcohol dehydrogenase family)